MNKLNESAVRMFADGSNIQQVANKFGCSRQAVMKYLNRRGMATAKRPKMRTCIVCGKTFQHKRKRLTCGGSCLQAHRNSTAYNDNRQLQIKVNRDRKRSF